MKSDEKIVVDLSKRNLLIGTISSLLFVIIAVFIFINAVKNNINSISFFDIFISIVTVLMFGFFFIMNIKKYFEKKPGLIITKQGIVDNSNGTSLNVLIYWKDVTNVENRNNFFNKSIILYINNHNTYIEKAKKEAPNILANLSPNSHSSKIAISPFSLDISQDELYEIIADNFKKYRSKKKK